MLKVADHLHCTVCPLAKQTKLAFPLSSHVSHAAFELIHCDIWGPYRVPTHSNKRYFVTIVDDYSRYTWIFLITCKSDTVVVLRQFFTQVKNIFSTSVKTLRTDNGGEFIGSACQDLLNEFGIYHQTTCVYTPQQNGIAERKHRTILDMARALRFQASIPLRFWGECVVTAVYLLNRLPSKILKFKSPFELLYNHPPSLEHLRVFGCLSYAACPKLVDKLSPRAIPVVFLGYLSNQKGYLLYDLHSKQFFINRHVVFQENIFPFKHMQTASNPIFPVLDLLSPELNNTNTPSTESVSSSPIHTPPPSDMFTTSELSPQTSQVPSDSPSPTPSPTVAPVATRQSSRQIKPSLWMHDYVMTSTSNSCLYPISNHVSYQHLSPAYQHALSAYSTFIEPTSFKAASQDPMWVAAMQQEIAALEDNHTWSLVDLPPGKKPIGCRWIYKIKYKSNGEVERFKARLVAKGYSQKEGLDYGETFSPVAKMVTVRSVIALAAAKHWFIYQMDVHNAFLNGDLVEEVYMQVPEGFARQEGNTKVCKLHKSLYGLKQAPRQWNLKLTESLVQMGFQQSHFDYSLFTRKSGSDIVIILVYVDDLLITGNNVKLLCSTRKDLQNRFKMKDLGEFKFFLGIECARSSKGIVLSQRKYALELIAESGLGGAKNASTPLELNQKLTSVQYDQCVPSSNKMSKEVKRIKVRKIKQ
ncbi:retrovirus-related Pol polyprotein from transposon RE1 isoform X2 [Lycium ferocissimum]|nr:retrovirus-related Pol polyprotein from transposon RE1 isoform X2 [Lycium ferocissimum]